MKPRFVDSFLYAAQGIRTAVREERNMRFHLCAAFYVYLFSLFYGFDKTEYILITLMVCGVLALELVNSAIERAVDKPDTTHWWSAGAAKDMAAGAVLVMAIGTVVVAVCLFWPRLDILWAAFTARPTRPLWLLLTLIVFYKFIFRSSNSTEKGKQPNGKTDS